MKLIQDIAGKQIWEVTESYGTTFLVYGYYENGDPKECPSLSMAYEYGAPCRTIKQRPVADPSKGTG